MGVANAAFANLDLSLGSLRFSDRSFSHLCAMPVEYIELKYQGTTLGLCEAAAPCLCMLSQLFLRPSISILPSSFRPAIVSFINFF